jgi:sulfatase maturation enzyme AslB (radical SAM superfamily)
MRDLKIAQRLLFKKGLPVNLIFFVTSRCNLLCQHCFYWEELNKKKNELTLDEIENLTRSLPNLLSVSLTGGEPYLRKDLDRIASAFEQNSGVRNIQIPSNGLLVDQTISRAETLLDRVSRARVSTGVSLDGLEEDHNRIRQNPKSFQRAIETFQALKLLKPRFPNLSVGIALTVSAANCDRLDSIFEYVTKELEPDAITITLARGNPLDASLTQVDLAAYREFAAKVVSFRRDHRLAGGLIDRMVIAKEEEVYRLVAEAAEATRRISPCYAGELSTVLSETGEVYLCETLDKSMGNVRDFNCDFASLWYASQAARARRYQKDLGCQCTYECAMSVNTLFNPRRALRIASRTLVS